MKLDTKDLKLLALLSEDCRTPSNPLGKKLGISREVVDYRIKRLVKEKLITDFIAEVDIKALGYTKYVMYIELKSLTKDRETHILNHITNHQFITWVAYTAGKWSFILDLHAQNQEQLTLIVNEIREFSGNNMGDYLVVPLQSHDYFFSKYFQSFKESKIGEKKIKNINKNTTLDKKDLIILKLLSRSARMSYVELAQHVKLTPEAVSKRVRQLYTADIIKCFTIFVDLRLLGFQHYNVQLKFDHASQQKEKEIFAFLKTHTRVSFIYKPIGFWDVEFGVFVKETEHLQMFMQELRNTFPEHIRVHDVLLFYEDIKGNYAPEGMFNSA